MEKQLKYADKKQIPFVIIIGPDEAKNNTVTVKILPQTRAENYPHWSNLSTCLKSKIRYNILHEGEHSSEIF